MRRAHLINWHQGVIGRGECLVQWDPMHHGQWSQGDPPPVNRQTQVKALPSYSFDIDVHIHTCHVTNNEISYLPQLNYHKTARNIP